MTRILRVKFALGLMDKDRSPLADRSLHKSFGSDEHRKVARQAVRESLVLLKNDKKTLPLAKTAGRIHVAGRGADSLGMQCGGWTIDWQGKMDNVVPGGTSILAADQEHGVEGHEGDVLEGRQGRGGRRRGRGRDRRGAVRRVPGRPRRPVAGAGRRRGGSPI